MIDFDDIDLWGPSLTDALRPLIPETRFYNLVATPTKFVDDALHQLFDLPNKQEIIDAAVAWVCSATIAGYHGTRLTHTEADSIRVEGLLPLDACDRRGRLERALSRNERWPEVADKLKDVLHAYGPGNRAGHRQNQLHLTLSRSGLTKDFPHYLTHGAEFDQRVAFELLGEEGVELLGQDGEATVIKAAVPGPQALDSANPYFSIECMRARGNCPNLIKEFLECWSYRLAHPSFQCRTLKVDCGMLFRSALPAAWIVSIDTVRV